MPGEVSTRRTTPSSRRLQAAERQLWEQLGRLHARRREEFRKRWKRSLPFTEQVFDRWERAKFLGFGAGTSIYDSSLVFGEVQVGEHTWIGPFTVLDGSGGLRIGSYCSISTGVQIYTHDSVAWALTRGTAGYRYAPVEIGDCCYVGPQTIIAKGVTVGPYSVVGANSFVNRTVSPYAVVAGNPARRIGTIRICGSEITIETRRRAR